MADKPILLIEDCQDDAFFFKRELAKALLKNPVHHVSSVDQAIAYLNGEAEFADRSRFPAPAIVVLDLHPSGKDGFEFLRWLEKQPHRGTLHVVVVSGVGRQKEIERAYQMGAHSFLTKPVKADEFKSLAAGFPAVWT